MKAGPILVSIAMALSGCRANAPPKGANAEIHYPETNTFSAVQIITTGVWVSVTVAEDTALNRIYEVPSSGVIDYPPLGRIAVKNLTTHELAAKIKEGLERDYIRVATVTAEVLPERPRPWRTREKIIQF